jgi:hypothetical protein
VRLPWIPEGEVILLQTVWDSGKVSNCLTPEQVGPLTYEETWYADAVDYEYKMKKPSKVERIFTSLGITGDL